MKTSWKQKKRRFLGGVRLCDCNRKSGVSIQNCLIFFLTS